MSGCIEVRELDLVDPALLPQALDALDVFMRYHRMMGYELVRLREVLGHQPDALPGARRVFAADYDELCRARRSDFKYSTRL